MTMAHRNLDQWYKDKISNGTLEVMPFFILILSCIIFANSTYNLFINYANSEVQKPTEVCVFFVVTHISGPFGEKQFTLTDSKGHVLCVSACQDSLLMNVITIDSSKKHNKKAAYELQILCVFEKRRKGVASQLSSSFFQYIASYASLCYGT